MGIDQLLHIFKFSMGTRKLIYTTNAIESVNSAYKKLNRQRSAFPNPTSLLKSLYLSTSRSLKNGLRRYETGAVCTANSA